MIKTGTISTNNKARHLYKLEDEIEAGIVLNGDEVKSLRMGHCDLKDSFVEVVNGQAYVIDMNIPQYAMSHLGSNPKRKRKLLLHKLQIRRLAAKTPQGGYTCVPISIYFNDKGFVKIRIAIAHGKKLFEHKDQIIRRDNERELSRAIKQRET